MPSNMPLPYANGRPPGAGATSRSGYTSISGRSSPSPLPTPSTSAFTKPLSNLISGADTYGSDAVMEKSRLSRRKHWFSTYPAPLPFTNRRLLLPLPTILHSTAPGLIAPNYRANHPRHGTFGSQRRSRSLKVMVSWSVGLFILVLLAFSRIRVAIRNSARGIQLPFQDPSTLIFTPDQIQRIWEWEISSGHYPSSRRLPTVVQLDRVGNPGLAKKNGVEVGDVDRQPIIAQGQARAPPAFLHDTVPIGPKRQYLNLTTPSVQKPSRLWLPPQPYPPRPKLNSIIDMDVIMNYCDFSTNQYVRDCLEILRLGGGLDPERRARRGKTDRWRHTYIEQDNHVGRKIVDTSSPKEDRIASSESALKASGYEAPDTMAAVVSDTYPLLLSGVQQSRASAGQRRDAIIRHPTHPTADPTCDADFPRLYHIFWAGPFTDKPYLAISSFLFTQNLGLHVPLDERGSTQGKKARQEFISETCRPQMWIWINPGPAAAMINPNARRDMFDNLAQNPWSAPFLHSRFSEVLKFKMWNTTEQLDGVPELREHWRDLPLFNSGGVKYGSAGRHKKKEDEIVTKAPVTIGVVVAEEDAKQVDVDGDGKGEGVDVVEEEMGRFGNVTRGEEALADDATSIADKAGLEEDDATTKAAAPKKHEDELFERIGSTSQSGYDRLSVVLSDMARFVLCHRFGGTYLDADTLLLRDWEELWGWKGQFAYRWSRLEKYNTAVLRLHRHSAVGSFLFKTALANGLDFHPMTISRYTKDAYIEGLLLRLPDALFDPAWLNTEYYQRDRPPFPYFKSFEDFFDSKRANDAGPGAVGFDGFFRGAYSYHFHNFWWIPFDPSRNWPDLGPRFEAGEVKARAKAMAMKLLTASKPTTTSEIGRAAPAIVTQDSTKTQPKLKTAQELERELMASMKLDSDDVIDDERDLGWATVLKRTFEAYLRGERPNMYGEWLDWESTE